MWIIWQGGGGEGPTAGAQVTKNNMKKIRIFSHKKNASQTTMRSRLQHSPNAYQEYKTKNTKCWRDRKEKEPLYTDSGKLS